MENLVIVIGLAILSFISGMLGLGVAFSAIPFLGLFMQDLVHQVQPLSLLLNGVTAFLSALGFAKSGFVDWKKAIYLSFITTLSAPIGALIAQFINQNIIWVIYFLAVLYLAYRLFKPFKARKVVKENFKLVTILAIPISVLSGLLGVGPGFLLMPTLILCGFDPKKAAGINAFAVCPPSFFSTYPPFKLSPLESKFNLYFSNYRCYLFFSWCKGYQSLCSKWKNKANFWHLDRNSNSL
ncbi:protein of unknown function DUF81 [Thermodesulfobacterium geofontis OPF15]|jgi:uncharacterized membrane protein YfcA|uniref:Probable membrane transporter protein n=1 Tax=Thermodesulfobacterium geofontis (strain OPF15) TaxID=795359 RepID=F8C5L1_THEGP|nr:sulfite exporter TauE/SafE family protein [Thermodesulfobacterium geofontis]AEH22990.1 protein of unknown function DUF81 [Thermodesulfobacterium geofontis OPF15]